MRTRTLLLSAAALTLLAGAAIAHEHRDGPMASADANSDGFINRAEAQALAERMFGHMDSNGDGKLDATDRGGHERHVMIRREGRSDGVAPPADAAQRIERVEREVVIERDGEDDHRGHDRGDHRGGRGHGERMRGGPPVFMMAIMNSDEADRNNDGALSKAEFIAQHMRFFDAADANGDGKIRFDPPPMMEHGPPPPPPEPPAPPPAPQPPR